MNRPEDDDPRRRRLRRMRTIATGLLALMALVFVATALAARRWPSAAASLNYLRAFAEAAMVGGCADWFAVTALFRRPLGLPIPHTAIVPRSQRRIGEGLGRFIVDNFLSARVVDAKLRQLRLAAWGAEWLSQPDNARRVARWTAARIPALLKVLPAEAVGDLARSAALGLARSVPAAPAASRLLAAAWTDDRTQTAIAQALDWLAAALAEHDAVITEAVEARSWRWVPKTIDRAIARKITEGLVELLAEMRSPDHPLRQSLAAAVEGLIIRLAEDPALRKRGEALKLRLLADPRLGEAVRRFWLDNRDRLDGDWARRAPALEARLEALFRDLGVWLRDDVGLRRTLDTSARILVRTVLAPRRQDIGRFVAQVVSGWDAAAVVERLELQVGPDLQYIRISGALVGGFVGLGLYALSRLFGLT